MFLVLFVFSGFPSSPAGTLSMVSLLPTIATVPVPSMLPEP